MSIPSYLLIDNMLRECQKNDDAMRKLMLFRKKRSSSLERYIERYLAEHSYEDFTATLLVETGYEK